MALGISQRASVASCTAQVPSTTGGKACRAAVGTQGAHTRPAQHIRWQPRQLTAPPRASSALRANCSARQMRTACHGGTAVMLG
eukprot:6519652-Alexandrium_andersonii.AAC.1